MTTVRSYYETLESRLGYLLVNKGSQHFGYYPDGNENISENEAQRAHHNLLASHLKITPRLKILDAGCGQGFVACDLAKRYNASITGVDIVPYIIERATNRARREKVDKKTSFQVMDYSHLSFPDNFFDRVYTVETLCHAPDLSKAISELYRVLKPGGKLVFVEYFIENKKNFSNLERAAYELIAQATASPSLDCFQHGVFVSYLKKAGLKDIRVQNITQNFKKSLYRFYRIARYPYKILTLLRLRKKFINTTIGVEFYKLAEKDFFGYAVYSANK